MTQRFILTLLTACGIMWGSSGAMAENRSLPTEYAPLVEMARNHAEALQAAHEGAWKMHEAENWGVDLSAGVIQWSFADGTIAQAPVELLGTWNPSDRTFLNGWEHPSAPPGSAVASLAMKDFAEANGIERLARAKMRCEFDDCWDIAAVAALIGDLQGIYRADAGNGSGPWVYLGFGDVRLSKNR